jgi:23S rRNA (cytidine1920-2'-O)/16S rRNA (cytidine1409-2'-O)-methyltransferase
MGNPGDTAGQVKHSGKSGKSRVRVDQALVDRGLMESRTRAQAAILAGHVRINDQPARKAGDLVREQDRIEVMAPEKYVSRGGHKLEHGLTHFGILPAELIALDLGASTGGFTDCLLQSGAAQVWAVDVGQGQLAWKLRKDPRVVVRERTNARHLVPANFGADFTPFDLVVIDCSFISLRHILPPVPALLRVGGHVIALIKPQFEAGRREVDRGSGVITDPAIHSRVLGELETFVAQELPELQWRGVVESPLTGPAGNKEFLVLLNRITT